jgi:hypothetical protein
MTLDGSVRNGVIVLDNGQQLAEGTRVQVVVAQGIPESSEPTKPTLSGLLEIAGSVKNLPPDFAAQHDHYLHGTPKR